MLNFKSNKGRSIACLSFLLSEVILYVFIQVSSGFAERLVSFSSVVFAALFAAAHISRARESILTSLGLVFTVCSDFFLVLIENQERLVAMIFFSLVQICYFLCIFFENKGKRLKSTHLSVRISVVLFAIFLTLIVLGNAADALSLISMFYFANLLMNIAFAFVNFRKAPLLAIGLVLFALCDVLVGLSLIDMYIPISDETIIYKITHTKYNLIWTFYVPSQALIALSAAMLKYKAKK